MLRFGREFFKMSGSGNDFVFFDTRTEPPGILEAPATVTSVCARATGVGADGVVFLGTSNVAAFGIRYLNRDGSVAALCGNAALCSARLAVELGVAPSGGFDIETDAGLVTARVIGDRPEIDIGEPEQVDPAAAGILAERGEERIGFAVVGVPHLVVLCDDLISIDIAGRGSSLRRHVTLRAGANVNFVAADGDGWRIRTYERGVEAETLACGTGAAASAAILAAWGLAHGQVRFRTRSGSTLEVGLPTADAEPDRRRLRLRGPARIVFRGRLGDLAASTD